MMRKRSFKATYIIRPALLLLSVFLSLTAHASLASPIFARHLPATVASSAGLPVPEKQRAPFGWTTATVTTADKPPLVLRWDALPGDVTPTHLRIAIGLDERDEKSADVFLPESGRVLGMLDLRFVTQFQLYQLPLKPADVAGILREGAALRLTKGSDLEILTGGPACPEALLPHLLVPGTASPMEEFLARMSSLASVQQFGWMEGCVLDGLLDLAELPGHRDFREMAQKHLDLFFQDDQLIYENHLSAPSDNEIYGIEGTLPFAALARVDPQHPLLELPLQAWEWRRRPTGSIQDRGHLSSEGAYTVAYPLALIAKARHSEAMMQDALYQVRFRQARFFDGHEFWRTHDDDGKRGNRNWARGIAWQMLGLVRTLEVAKDRRDIGDLVIHLQRFAAWAITHQREDGLWSVFADEPDLVPDTAGSAGIGAALALGSKHGWLDETATAAAQRTLSGLKTHLTPDGFLGGVSQSNKGGQGLQRSDYRAIYQMGMGLMAQLVAALER